MKYPDTLLIERPSEGDTRTDDVWVPGTGTTIYNDSCDAQDATQEMERAREGTPRQPTEVTVFLKDETKLKDVEIEDIALITFADGTQAEGTVKGVRKLDGVVQVGEVSWPI